MANAKYINRVIPLTRAYRGVPGPSKFKGGDTGCLGTAILLAACAFPLLIPVALLAVCVIDTFGDSLHYGIMKLSLLFLAIISPVFVIISWFDSDFFEGGEYFVLCIYYMITISEIIYGLWKIIKNRQTISIKKAPSDEKKTYIIPKKRCRIKCKFDVFTALKSAGYSMYRIRRDKLLSKFTIQRLCRDDPIPWADISTLCGLLGCQPGDIMEYVEDDRKCPNQP